MKQEIKFNHNVNGIFEALGIDHTNEELSEKMASICMRFTMSDGDKVSKLAEKIYKEFPENVILLLAVQGVLETMKGAIEDLENSRSDSQRAMSLIAEMMHMTASGRSINKSVNPKNN